MKFRMISFFAALVAACSLVMALPVWAFAAEVRGGRDATVTQSETIDDDLFTGGGQTVTVSGHITGDVYAVAATVIVNGSIDGDLIAAAQQVTVDGSVAGNVRAAGASVTINGSVGRSVTGIAQHVTVTSSGRIGGSIVGAAQTIDAFGQVGRGITVGGGTLQLAGPVGGPVLARVESLSVAPSAHVQGSLDYQAKQETALPAGSVSGAVHFEPTPQQAPRPAPLLNGLFDVGGLITMFGSFLIGAVALVLMPRVASRATELGRKEPWPSFAIGLAVLVCTPIAAIIVAVTLIGIPLAIITVAMYVLAVLLAWPAVALVVGEELTRVLRPNDPLPILGTLAVGLIVLHLVTHVPFIGGLVGFCALAFGLGMLAQVLRRWRRPTQRPTAAEWVPAAA